MKIRACARRAAALVIAQFVAAAALAVPSFAAEDEVGGGDGFWGPGPADVASASFQARIAADVAQAAAAEAALLTPEAQAEREASRIAFSDLEPYESAELAAAAFPAVIVEPTWNAPTAPAGTEIVSYEGRTAALIAPQGAEVNLENLPAELPAGAPPEPGDLTDSGALLEKHGAAARP